MKYVVDCFISYGKSIEVEASSATEAQEKALAGIADKTIDVSDFERLDDTEAKCVGKVSEDGERVYFFK